MLAGGITGCGSGVAPATNTPPQTAATPTFSLAPGTYAAAQTVTVSDSTAGATIYYTTSGAAPTTASTPYTGPVTIAASETLEAIAVATGYTSSSVASAAYVITPPAPVPTFSVAAGTYTTSQSVTITDPLAGAQIFYATNGSAPRASSTPYTGPVAVAASETLQANATAAGYTASPVASPAYTITPPAAAPTFAGKQLLQ